MQHAHGLGSLGHAWTLGSSPWSLAWRSTLVKDYIQSLWMQWYLMMSVRILEIFRLISVKEWIIMSVVWMRDWLKKAPLSSGIRRIAIAGPIGSPGPPACRVDPKKSQNHLLAQLDMCSDCRIIIVVVGSDMCNWHNRVTHRVGGQNYAPI